MSLDSYFPLQDIGDVPDWFRRYLAAPGILSRNSVPNTLVSIGDSIAANSYVESGTTFAYTDIGIFSWARALLSGRFADLNPRAALGGTTTTDWVSRVETEVLPYSPGWVFCYLGTNDISGDIPFEQSVANFKRIFGRILAQGSRLVVCTILPYGAGNANLTVARNVARSKLNAWLTWFATTTPNVELVDLHKIFIDSASATGAARSGYLWDDLHPSATGARAGGTEIASVVDSVSIDKSFHVSSFAENYSYSSSALNKVSNPLFNSASGTAGASSAGAGTTITATSIARDWTVATVAGGTSTTVCTTPAAPDGIGNSQRLVISGTNATDQVTLRTGSLASSRLVAGEILSGEAFISLSSCTALEGVRLTWSYIVDGVTYSYSDMSPQIKAYSQADLTKMLLKTPPFQVRSGTLTSGQLSVALFFDGAGGATANIWRAGLLLQPESI